MVTNTKGIKMRLIKSIFLLCLLNYVSCTSLTESMGQEVIEISAPIKELPQELEEEPSAENEDEKHTSTTIQAATKKEFTKTTFIDFSKKGKDIDKIDGRRQEDDEARIEKELADIYKDSIDYKADSAEVIKEVKVSTSSKASETSSTIDADATTAELTGKPLVRARMQDFKFQPDSNNPRDVARFRTSIDEISCDNKLSATKSPSIATNASDRFVADFILWTTLLFTVCI
ncbi:uncharacterized protein LOC123879715 [Maniola jurtina]|uniref:uncharacterized protein LOC123879715 n=1 Tax=Maniola jurtina TaxID=191418 RepID=UPI001E6878CF|nr:uncharacterized protein LOC123879715 [Maniola jurtina]